ncbi:MAG: M20/M25/M40 family metallo-hydrolase [Bacteroidales bacterium]
MKTKISLLSLLLLSTTLIFSQIIIHTDGNDTKAIISFIASDEFKGRKTGTPEEIKTEEFFAGEFKKLGLKPAGENATYFHTYNISDYEVKNGELKIGDRNCLMGFDLDFNVAYNSLGGSGTGEIVFVGYGINAPDKMRIDLDSVDLKGKIALVLRGCPANNFEKWGEKAIDSVKVMDCYKRGAIAVLFFEPTNYNINQYRFNENRLALYEKVKDFPVLNIREHVAQYILNGTQLPYSRMIRTIDEKSSSLNTGKIATLKVEINDVKLKARNVLAVLPGSDPKLKNEFIIIGGHLDHVGVNAKNEIRNGADDNASGVAVTLGIARAMAKNKFKPKRSIIFACWSGEEMGLLGSEAWCEKPTINLYKTVVYFNLDMVGLGDGGLNMPGTLFAPEVTEFIKQNTRKDQLEKIHWSDGGLGGSDHNPFLLKGIPAFAGMTSGDHPDYHQPADDPDKIKPEIVEFVGDFIGTSAANLANSKNNFISQKRFNENRAQLKALRTLFPISYNNFAGIIENSKVSLASVNFSDGLKGTSEENFISLLKSLYEAENRTQLSIKWSFKYTAFDALTRMRRNAGTSILAGFNFSAVGFNHLYINALSKNGFRLGIIDEGFANLQDLKAQEEFLNLVNKLNIGVLVSADDIEKTKVALEKSKFPIMVLTNSNQKITDEIKKLVKSNGHFISYLVDVQSTFQENLDIIKALYNDLGSENLILTCNLADQKSVDLYKYIAIELEKTLSIDKAKKITEENLNIFIGKSIQDYPVKLTWR